MTKHDPAKVLAANLNKFFAEHLDIKGNQSELARRSGVAQTSIGYMLKPELRPPTKKGVSSPTLENIDRVARALGRQAWQLIYPNPEAQPASPKEIQLYERLSEDIQALQLLVQQTRATYEPKPPLPTTETET